MQKIWHRSFRDKPRTNPEHPKTAHNHICRCSLRSDEQTKLQRLDELRHSLNGAGARLQNGRVQTPASSVACRSWPTVGTNIVFTINNLGIPPNSTALLRRCRGTGGVGGHEPHAPAGPAGPHPGFTNTGFTATAEQLRSMSLRDIVHNCLTADKTQTTLRLGASAMLHQVNCVAPVECLTAAARHGKASFTLSVMSVAGPRGARRLLTGSVRACQISCGHLSAGEIALARSRSEEGSRKPPRGGALAIAFALEVVPCSEGKLCRSRWSAISAVWTDILLVQFAQNPLQILCVGASE